MEDKCECAGVAREACRQYQEFRHTYCRFEIEAAPVFIAAFRPEVRMRIRDENLKPIKELNGEANRSEP